MSEWQDIETAPKDGTVVDLWSDRAGRITNVRWISEPRDGIQNQSCIMDGWKMEGDKNPYGCLAEDQFSHWMTLPAPPKPSKE